MKKRKFELEHEPISYVISVHLNNLMATYGKDKVKEIVDIIYPQQAPKRRKKVS